MDSSDLESDVARKSSRCKVVELQPDDLTKKPTVPSGNKKLISILFGLLILVVVVLGIMALMDVLRENDISLAAHQEPPTAVITLEELATHDSEDDCWLSIYGKVYDLTNFLHRHPRGGEVILELAGKNATEEYGKEHASPDLLRQVENFIVGVLAEDILMTANP